MRAIPFIYSLYHFIPSFRALFPNIDDLIFAFVSSENFFPDFNTVVNSKVLYEIGIKMILKLDLSEIIIFLKKISVWIVAHDIRKYYCSI